MGVKIERTAEKIRRDEENCFECGACTGVGTSGALFVQRLETSIVFDAEKCIGFSFCVPICPVRAMEVSLDDNFISTEKIITSSMKALCVT